jgi:hypothetical protein
MTMPSENNAALVENPYSLSSVNKTAAPAGTDGNDWYRYVVERENSTIVGCMRGTLQQVTTYAIEFVEKLNVRSHTRKNYSTWSPPHQKKTAAPKKLPTKPLKTGDAL